MPAAEYNIPIDQGSDWTVELVVSEDGVVKDITGYLARAQMRPKKNSATISATFVCDVHTPVLGKLSMSLPNAISTALTAAVYYYDLEIYTAGDAQVTRLIKGKVTLDGEVTKP
jgi:hypothetical protein